MKKKCILLAVLLVASLWVGYFYFDRLPLSTWVSPEPSGLESWIDYAADSFAGGTGTEEDPYLIATAEQLAYLSKQVNGGIKYTDTTFKLIKNITLKDREWEAIGHSAQNNFQGRFQGNRMVISGLIIRNSRNHQGLFGYAELAYITDLGLEDVDIYGKDFIGGLIGALLSSADSNANSKLIVDNCYVTGKIRGNDKVGGLAGFVGAGTTFIRTKSCATIEGNNGIGGIIGVAEGTRLLSCSSIGSIVGNFNTGGIIGILSVPKSKSFGCSGDEGPKIRSELLNCHMSGHIKSNFLAGGIIGTLSQASLKECSVSGTIEGKKLIGGLVGEGIKSTIESSVAFTILRKTDSAFGNTHIGSLVARNSGGRIYNNICLKNNFINIIGKGVLDKSNFELSATIPRAILERRVPFSIAFLKRPKLQFFQASIPYVFGKELQIDACTWQAMGPPFIMDDDYAIFVKRENEFYLVNLNVNATLLAADAVSAQTTHWIDSAADKFAAGSGKEKDPYQISTPEELAFLARSLQDLANIPPFREFDKTFDSKNFFQLTSNIDLSQKKWSSIGATQPISYPFSGCFDGNGKTIHGLTKELFGYLKDCTIEDIVLSEVDITSNIDITGSLAIATVWNLVFIKNCSVSGRIQGKNVVGGLIGSGEIFLENILCSADVSGQNDVGGIIGTANKASLNNCVVIGTVTGKENVGGFIGKSYSTRLTNSMASNILKTSLTKAGNLIGFSDVSDVIEDNISLNQPGYMIGNSPHNGGNNRQLVASDKPSYNLGVIRGLGNINKMTANISIRGQHYRPIPSNFVGLHITMTENTIEITGSTSALIGRYPIVLCGESDFIILALDIS